MSLQIFIELQKAFGHILYDDKPHTYLDQRTNNFLCSVTTNLKDYGEDFDDEKWSSFKSLQEGISQIDTLKSWSIAREYGVLKGSIVHDYLENRIQNKKFVDSRMENSILYQPELEHLISLAEMFVNEFFTKGYIVVKPELIVGSDTHGGQMDLLAWKDYFVPFDYKTDKSIETKNPHDQFKNLPTLLEEELLDKRLIDNCNFNKYSLQVNAYRQFLEKYTTIKCSKTAYVIWFNYNNEKPVWIELPYIESPVFKNM